MHSQQAMEGLGSLGTKECLRTLEKGLNDPSLEVVETCQIAICLVNWNAEHPECQDECNRVPKHFCSIDPAPSSEIQDISRLSRILMEPTCTLFERYRAMFSLRNIGTDEAVRVWYFLSRQDTFDNDLFTFFRLSVKGSKNQKVLYLDMRLHMYWVNCKTLSHLIR